MFDFSNTKEAVNILGTEYKIEIHKPKDDDYIEKEHVDGYCCSVRKLIVVLDFNESEYMKDYDEKSIKEYFKQVLRHELIHAYLNESGLDCNTLQYSGCWTKNEEMVDWFAIQSPKIYETFKEMEVL